MPRHNPASKTPAKTLPGVFALGAALGNPLVGNPLGALVDATPPADAVEIGYIGDAWGVKGGFKVVSHSGEVDALLSSKSWFVRLKQQRPTEPGRCVSLSIATCKPHADGLVATSREVTDRDAALALKGASIWVARASFPVAAADEYYWVDLIGLQVFNREGVALGEVVDLIATGPHDVLVLLGGVPMPVEPTKTKAGPDPVAAQRMIPFVAAFVDDVDLAAKRITVDWQPDY